MTASRTENSKRNIYTGLTANIVSILCGFVSKTLILRWFGIEYNGSMDLFNSILGVLNFSEMGFSTAIVVYMYDPIAKGDVHKVNSLLNFFKKIYHSVGIIILMAGLIIMPFVSHLVHNDPDVDINLQLLYVIYLLNDVTGYFMFAYRGSLLDAVQRQDLAKKSAIYSQIAVTVFKVIICVCTVDFYLFCVTMIIGTLIGNILSAWYSEKYFPEYKCEGKIDDSTKRNIFTMVKGIALVNLGGFSRNTFDSIVISLYFGLIAVGRYGLYFYIYNTVYTGILVITNAIQSSVGNSIATESVEKNYNDMLHFQLMFSTLSMWAFNCLLLCYQPFMEVWAGKKNLLPMTDAVLFCIYFYIMSLTSIRNLYVNGNGLWWSLKYITIAEAVGNLVLNFVLGKFFGIAGVLTASIVTMLLFNYIMINRKLFREYFHQGEGRYYKLIISTALVTIGTALISYEISTLLPSGGWAAFCMNLVIATAVSISGFWIVFRKTDLYKGSMELVKKMLPHRH